MEKSTFKLGNLKIHYRAIPAPMASITDIVFRKLLDEIGCVDYMITEMISAEGLRRQQTKTLEIMRSDGFKTPQLIQLFGWEPSQFADAVSFIENETPFSGVDLNMGCPAGKVVRKGGGAALLKDPLKAASIIREIKTHTRLPITVKLRLGFNTVNILDMLQAIDGEGADAVTVHFRLRSEGYSGNANWEYAPIIREQLKEKALFIGNGDIKTAAEAKEKLNRVDCVMIGRGAVINPFIFAEMAGIDPAGFDTRRMVFHVLELIETYYHPMFHLSRFKAYARFLFSNRQNSKKIRQHIYSCHTFDEVKRVLHTYFEVNHESL
ncbi:MAG: tRNA dihydrouridine synthase [Candidatus Omnitrophota bacterium]